MQITLSTSNVKIFSRKDCIEINSGKCLINESFFFQLYLETETAIVDKIEVLSDLNVKTYLVKKMKGDFYLDKKVDDYYVYAEDHLYPDLLVETTTIEMQDNSDATIFVEVPATEKTAGLHLIKIKIANEEIIFPLTVINEHLIQTDLNLSISLIMKQ